MEKVLDSMHNMVVPILAFISILSAAISGFDFAVEKITPPLIQGYVENSPTVFAGETTKLEWHITKRTDCSGFVGRTWEGQDGFRMTEPQRFSALPKTDGEQVYKVQTVIPYHAPDGDLKLTVKGYYDCEGGKEYFSLDTVNITVISKPGL